MNKEYIVLLTVYDLHGYFARYHERLVRLFVIAGFIFTMILLMLYFIRKFFTQQLERMVDALTHDREV
ncbi:hypothetical protein, partial [Hydrogenimonas sp.]